jgi:MinD superfamily P-loop ATPase
MSQGPFRIAIASGKGGVGKTTLAVAMAAAAARDQQTIYVDCDVETPNGYLLLQPTIDGRYAVARPVPAVDSERCDRNRACEQACQFGAIVCLGDTVDVNPHLCKSCGACVAACQRAALREVDHSVGYLETGYADSLRLVHGVLKVGEARSLPLIDALKARIAHAFDLAILDAPPGTACPMVTAVRDADYLILVTEATPFGKADLATALDTVKAMNIPVGVIINRSDRGDERLRDCCQQRGVAVLAEVPYCRDLAEGYADGDLLRIRQTLGDLPRQLLERVYHTPQRRAG